MQNIFIQYVFLILVILALMMVAKALKIAYPIILLLGGLALSLTNIFSDVTIAPDAIFFIFLPPLLYEAAWQISWKEFWKWRRVITSFAFPIVIITSCVIAFISSAIIPGFPLAFGFLLGGIVSPPDAVSATAIMQSVKVPKSLVTIIEGESLLNDASSLIVFRFALAAIFTGQFDMAQATWTFFLVVSMGMVIGLAVGVVFYYIHRLLPTTSSIEIVLTLVTPYCMYYAAEHFHFSGVLSVVTGGLFLSSQRQTMLNYRSRIEGVNVWTNIVFVMNGLIFLLIGLQLPAITEQLGDISTGTAIWYGLAISFILIITRLLITFGAAGFTRIVSRFITVADSNPGWREPLIAGWAGMRGVVSLAAALSVPVMLENNTPFPNRNLILFITFIVILVTLVFQGLTLPWLIGKVKPRERFSLIPRDKQEIIIQKKIARCSLNFLEERYPRDNSTNEFINNLHTRFKLDLDYFDPEADPQTRDGDGILKKFQNSYLELLDEQRSLLSKMNRKEEFDEELIRKYLALLDLEEYKVREKM